MDGLNQIIGSGNSYGQIGAVSRSAAAARTREEFLTIFYKEMLKQVFKTPDLSIGTDEEEKNSSFAAFNKDLMVEQLAGQLARNAALSQGWLAPPAESAAANE